MVLNLELHAESHDHSVVEVGSIFLDDSFRDAIPTDEFRLYKSGDYILGNKGERGCFNLFYKVVNGNNNEAMSIRSSMLDFYNHINAPHFKRPRSSQNI